jgi:hypothetical protein
MRMTGLRTVAKSEIVLSVNAATRGTVIIMVPTMTNLTDIVLWLEGAMKGESRPFLST